MEKENSKKINKRMVFFCISTLISIIGAVFFLRRIDYGVIPDKNVASMTIDMVGIFMITIAMGGCALERTSDTRKVEKFVHFLMLMTFMWFVDMVTWGIDFIDTDFAVIMAMIFDSLYYLCNIMAIAAFIIYLSDVVRINPKKLQVYWICVGVVFLALLILIVLNIWLPIFFEIKDGVYYRLPPTNIVFIIGGLLLVSVVYLLGDTHMDKIEKFAIGGYVILPLGFMILQMISYGFAFVPLAGVISTGMIYVHMYLHQSTIMEQQRNELQKKQTAVMLSQIQPHFLFNSLNTIVALCDLDPKLAKQTTIDFSTYLEHNLNSLTDNDLIPFDKELEQVKAYLNIEKARFGDFLKVVYDLKTENFRIPSLTVQPMVENAVKHGIQPMPDGGTLWISTSEETDCWIVQIRDNGCGFDCRKDNAEGFGIGIDNTRKRLEVMCGGEMKIAGEKGSGTTVTIRIPKENKIW